MEQYNFFVYGNKDNLAEYDSTVHRVQIDGKAAPNTEKNYALLNKLFRLGNDFGNNLDALFDSMTDLSWYESTEFVLEIDNSHEWLSDEDEYEVRALLLTLRDIAGSINDEPLNSTKNRKMSFYFDECDRICDILDDAGVDWDYAD